MKFEEYELKRKVIRIGNSLGIIFGREEVKNRDIRLGDFIKFQVVDHKKMGRGRNG